MVRALVLAGSTPWHAFTGTVDLHPAESDFPHCNSSSSIPRQSGGIQRRAGVVSRIQLWNPLRSRLLVCRSRLRFGLAGRWESGYQIPKMERFVVLTGRGLSAVAFSRRVAQDTGNPEDENVGSTSGGAENEEGKESSEVKEKIDALKDLESELSLSRRGWLAELKLAFGSLLEYFPMLQLKVEEADIPTEPTGASFTWDGWGTSLCWWANFTGGLPEVDRDHILDLIFDKEKGLGLNIARYNIGGGADMKFDTNLRPFADVPGFKAGPDEPYDWSADERQRIVLFGARARGVDVLEAFANSPPPWMTQSGSVTGNWKKGADNLKPGFHGAFADYLVDVVEQYKTKWETDFDYLAPFNEPVEGFWNIDRRKPAQEGCNFSVPSIEKLVLEVQKSLARKGLSTKISAADAWSMDTERVFQGLGKEAVDAISQVNVHTYLHTAQRESNTKRTEARNCVKRVHGKSLWMSEYGPLGWSGPELEIALAVGKHITLDINELQCSAWCYWQVVEQPGKNNLWGLLQTKFKYDSERLLPFSFKVHVKKQYYIMLQFSRWIRPGFTIFASEGSFKDWVVMAVDSSTKATAVYVFTNATDRLIDVNLDVSGIAPALKGSAVHVARYRTTDMENHKTLPSTVSESPVLTTNILGRSVTTVVVTKAPTASREEEVATI